MSVRKYRSRPHYYRFPLLFTFACTILVLLTIARKPVVSRPDCVAFWVCLKPSGPATENVTRYFGAIASLTGDLWDTGEPFSRFGINLPCGSLQQHWEGDEIMSRHICLMVRNKRALFILTLGPTDMKSPALLLHWQGLFAESVPCFWMLGVA